MIKTQWLWTLTLITELAVSPAFAQEDVVDRIGDRIDHRLDRKGEGIDNRLDRRGDRLEERFDRKGDRIENRLDRKGEIIDNRLDRKADRAREAGHDQLADRPHEPISRGRDTALC